MNKEKCPECKQILKNMYKCICGWRMPYQNVPQRDRRCEYTMGPRRCPLLGTVCNFTHGDGPWFCSDHSRTFDKPKLAEAVLLDAEENYEAIMESRRDWRDKLWDTPGVRPNEKK